MHSGTALVLQHETNLWQLTLWLPASCPPLFLSIVFQPKALLILQMIACDVFLQVAALEFSTHNGFQTFTRQKEIYGFWRSWFFGEETRATTVFYESSLHLFRSLFYILMNGRLYGSVLKSIVNIHQLRNLRTSQTFQELKIAIWKSLIKKFTFKKRYTSITDEWRMHSS